MGRDMVRPSAYPIALTSSPHYQQYNVIWNGNGGKVVFFQNELAYDVPSQAAWMEAPGVNGWAALKVSDRVKTFNGYGMGGYSFFNSGVDLRRERVRGAQDARAREPAQPAHDLPGPDQRQGRDPERRQRCRGLVDHRQPVSCRHGGQLPGGVTVGSSVLKRYEFSPRAVQVLSRRGSPSSGC